MDSNKETKLKFKHNSCSAEEIQTSLRPPQLALVTLVSRGWHQELTGHESEQTPGESGGHRSLACCSLWGSKESDTTQQLNNWNTGWRFLVLIQYLSDFSLYTSQTKVLEHVLKNFLAKNTIFFSCSSGGKESSWLTDQPRARVYSYKWYIGISFLFS